MPQLRLVKGTEEKAARREKKGRSTEQRFRYPAAEEVSEVSCYAAREDRRQPALRPERRRVS